MIAYFSPFSFLNRIGRKGTPLTLEQAQALLENVREHRLEVLLTMAVVTGIRRGELLALRWSNVDFDRRTLLVLHTVDYIPKYGYVETEPETAAGKRLVSLPPFLVDMLRQHHIQQLEQQLKQGETWENRDLVFPDLRGGYFNPNYLLRLFKKLLVQAGIPHMHFHDLRHSAATILLSMGVNMKVIQELLGHSDIAITLGLYAHLLPTMQQEVVEKWKMCLDMAAMRLKSRGVNVMRSHWGYALTFALMTVYDSFSSKTKPLGKPVPKRFCWWRWGGVEPPVQTNLSENVLQA